MNTEPSQETIERAVSESARVTSSLQTMAPQMAQAAAIIADRMQAGGRLFVLGNGGSAAEAQHIAAEFVGRFEKERQPLPAIALTTDTSALTAIGNDYGFEETFARQLRALARPGDVLLALSTSGTSANVIRALDAAREMNLKTIALSGRTGGKMCERAEICFRVPSDSTPRIQEAHLLISHIVCSLVEASYLAE
jgi:D-sedoheptulose 7-phosphate isomerase